MSQIENKTVKWLIEQYFFRINIRKKSIKLQNKKAPSNMILLSKGSVAQ